jgi:hypothetical protein|tara:strand:- start:80 stop:304 length:225 start_codon:yes stop_codon:yes gene_type:complete
MTFWFVVVVYEVDFFVFLLCDEAGDEEVAVDDAVEALEAFILKSSALVFESSSTEVVFCLFSFHPLLASMLSHE